MQYKGFAIHVSINCIIMTSLVINISHVDICVHCTVVYMNNDSTGPVEQLQLLWLWPDQFLAENL